MQSTGEIKYYNFLKIDHLNTFNIMLFHVTLPLQIKKTFLNRFNKVFSVFKLTVSFGCDDSNKAGFSIIFSVNSQNTSFTFSRVFALASININLQRFANSRPSWRDTLHFIKNYLSVSSEDLKHLKNSFSLIR